MSKLSPYRSSARLYHNTHSCLQSLWYSVRYTFTVLTAVLARAQMTSGPTERTLIYAYTNESAAVTCTQAQAKTAALMTALFTAAQCLLMLLEQQLRASANSYSVLHNVVR
eukprot:3160-Heterococcus_DN1.PRE.5